jgi:hypothetical protein
MKLSFMLKLPKMLKLYILIPVCPNLVLTKWTQLISFQAKIHGKTNINCLVGYVDKQIAKFTVVIQRSSIKNPMLELVCERSDDHKVPKKKLKYEATGSRKCGCMSKLHGYVSRELKAWKLTILNGIHNHGMTLKL